MQRRPGNQRRQRRQQILVHPRRPGARAAMDDPVTDGGEAFTPQMPLGELDHLRHGVAVAALIGQRLAIGGCGGEMRLLAKPLHFRLEHRAQILSGEQRRLDGGRSGIQRQYRAWFGQPGSPSTVMSSQRGMAVAVGWDRPGRRPVPGGNMAQREAFADETR